jgi:hypothetical protein
MLAYSLWAYRKYEFNAIDLEIYGPAAVIYLFVDWKTSWFAVYAVKINSGLR